jgi:hypothetical protein
MAAHVEQGGGVAFGIAEQDDRFVADPPSQRLFGDLIGPGGDVPGIMDELSGALPDAVRLVERRLSGT